MKYKTIRDYLREILQENGGYDMDKDIDSILTMLKEQKPKKHPTQWLKDTDSIYMDGYRKGYNSYADELEKKLT